MIKSDSSNLLLLIEDNEADVDLTRDSLLDYAKDIEVEVAGDGAVAMDYLMRPADENVLPRLIMLDLNLPRLDGRHVLRAVKSDQILRRIPVIVFSSSTAQRDIADCYDLGASCYLCKPIDLVSYREMVRTVERFWMQMVRLPRGSGVRESAGIA
jgi:chemotaxis family two-component system response regulator Rcp1